MPYGYFKLQLAVFFEELFLRFGFSINRVRHVTAFVMTSDKLKSYSKLSLDINEDSLPLIKVQRKFAGSA